MSSEQKEAAEAEGEEARMETEEVPPWEADYQLLVCEGLFSEYLEMGMSGPAGFVHLGLSDGWG